MSDAERIAALERVVVALADVLGRIDCRCPDGYGGVSAVWREKVRAVVQELRVHA